MTEETTPKLFRQHDFNSEGGQIFRFSDYHSGGFEEFVAFLCDITAVACDGSTADLENAVAVSNSTSSPQTHAAQTVSKYSFELLVSLAQEMGISDEYYREVVQLDYKTAKSMIKQNYSGRPVLHVCARRIIDNSVKRGAPMVEMPADLPPHLQRVITEYRELNDKMKKLEKFLDPSNNAILQTLSSGDLMLLRDQDAAMSSYASILLRRVRLQNQVAWWVLTRE